MYCTLYNKVNYHLKASFNASRFTDNPLKIMNTVIIKGPTTRAVRTSLTDDPTKKPNELADIPCTIITNKKFKNLTAVVWYPTKKYIGIGKNMEAITKNGTVLIHLARKTRNPR